MRGLSISQRSGFLTAAVWTVLTCCPAPTVKVSGRVRVFLPEGEMRVVCTVILRADPDMLVKEDSTRTCASASLTEGVLMKTLPSSTCTGSMAWMYTCL